MIQKLTDLIIRPSRANYNPNVDLGPPVFSIDHKHTGVRVDFQVKNRRNQTLECSFFHRTVEDSKKYPLMLYCHGNTGNRTNSYGTVYSMLRSKINVITFDFAGCGLSSGKTVSLGFFEQDDIADVLDYAIKTFSFIDTSRIGIWGRCMGAVSAILFTSRTDCISLLVLDSPFPDFVSLIRDYIQRVKIIPKWAEDYMYKKIRAKVKKQAHFDFEDIKPIERVANCRVPAFFIHGKNDGVIPPYLFKRIYDAYPVAKEYLELNTTHNGPRSDSTNETIAAFVTAKFFPQTKFGHFEPTPKQINDKAIPVLLTGSVASLDDFRFNEVTGDEYEEGFSAVKNAFENIAKDNTEEIKSLADLDEDMEGTKSQAPSQKDIKSAWGLFRGKHHHKKSGSKLKHAKEIAAPAMHKIKTELHHIFDRGCIQGTTVTVEEEESEISEDLLDTGEIANKDYLENSYIENAAKSTFASFRKKKKRPLAVVPDPN